MFHSACLRVCVILAGSVASNAVSNAQVPDPKPAIPSDVQNRGRFSWQHLNPHELQFGCLGISDKEEDKWGDQVAKGEPHERVAAAQTLWQEHSRRQATSVLQYLAGPPPEGEAFGKLKREVDASLRPQAILRELKEGDYLWGTWLAFLRPHKDLVPTLLAGIKDKPKMLSETILALGNSGDPRALEPLLDLLKSKEYRIAGDAANALGYLGNPEVEPQLIEALSNGENGWLQVNACRSLGQIGSRKALSALEKLAKNDSDTGTLNVKGAAEFAIERISKREKR